MITIWPAWPLVSISENELNRHLRHLQPWNYTTSLFLALRQLSRTFNTYMHVTDTVHRCACARANENVKDCYYSSQYKLGAQYSLADVSIIHVHVLEYGGVGIASQLGEEEKDEGDGVGRAEASTASFITNLFHPVVEMGHCSLHATKATSTSSTSRCERGIPLLSGRCLYFIFGFHSHMIINIFK